MPVNPLSIVIVGAGAAGLRLAQTLLTESSTPIKITILEANDYIGGRVRNFSFEGYTVELGANWISGLEKSFQNPIWQLAKKCNLRTNPSDRENPDRTHVIDCTNKDADDDNSDQHQGGTVVTSEYLEIAKRFDEIYAKSLEEINSPSSFLTFENDVDVKSVLEKNGWKPTVPLEYAVEHNLLQVWVAEDLRQLSAAHDMQEDANDIALGQDEVFVEDERGFNCIFRDVVKELEQCERMIIRTSTEVKTIQYLPGSTKVTALDLKIGEVAEYSADIVVSTVSLGVLQHGSIQFDPPLPKWKMEAFSEIGMFNFGKVFAKFQKKVWPQEKDYIVFICSQPGYYPLWMSYKHSKDNVMMCYLGGAEARRVESLTEDEIKDEIQEIFEKAFGRSKYCRPIAVATTDWSRNPRFQGSYSYFPKGAFGSIPYANFASGLTGLATETNSPVESLSKTLYFAGEAFDDKFNGWVQGGYLSGEKVAREIIKDLSKR